MAGPRRPKVRPWKPTIGGFPPNLSAHSEPCLKWFQSLNCFPRPLLPSHRQDDEKIKAVSALIRPFSLNCTAGGWAGIPRHLALYRMGCRSAFAGDRGRQGARPGFIELCACDSQTLAGTVAVYGVWSLAGRRPVVGGAPAL